VESEGGGEAGPVEKLLEVSLIEEVAVEGFPYTIGKIRV
jgi:hypothetical protein